MSRKRSHTRRNPRANPRGIIDVRRGGYGFVRTSEGEFFVPRSKMCGAFPGDVVEIAPSAGRGHQRKTSKDSRHKRAARVVRVVERSSDELVGYYRREEPFGVVVPADPRIQHDVFTQLAEHPDIPDGAVVRVRIATYPDRNAAATGHVLEVLGDEDDERVDIDLIVARHKLETAFSQAALDEAQEASVDAQGALSAGYRDLRGRFVFTIDPVDARDFDDAVSVERREGGWLVGVHIADVSHYVSWGSSIDLDARRRATSVYLADRVIPMLPEKLSNDLCSLRPGEQRRTMTVDMLVDDEGKVTAVEPYPALICSRARLTYGQAQCVLDGSEASCGLPAELIESLKGPLDQLSRIADRRARLRARAGGLDFDTVEAKVRLDDQGHPIDVELREKTVATQLVEEAMIMANESVARFLRDAGFPCLYRVHEPPARDSLEGLVAVFSEFAWFKDVDEARFAAGNPFAVRAALEAVEGKPESELVTTLVLRAMTRALYSPELSRHYGLASEAYAHFTSPIRRYPDLVVHRMLKAALFGRSEKFDQEVASLGWLAEHSSEMERVAEAASRESQEAKIVELMEEHLGETFSAVISGVASFGLFVRLDNTAEGVVEMADLGREYYILDPVRHLLTGSDTGRWFRLGRRLAVRLVEADRRTRQLRFRLA